MPPSELRWPHVAILFVLTIPTLSVAVAQAGGQNLNLANAALSRFGMDALIDRLFARPLAAIANLVSSPRPRTRGGSRIADACTPIQGVHNTGPHIVVASTLERRPPSEPVAVAETFVEQGSRHAGVG